MSMRSFRNLSVSLKLMASSVCALLMLAALVVLVSVETGTARQAQIAGSAAMQAQLLASGAMQRMYQATSALRGILLAQTAANIEIERQNIGQGMASAREQMQAARELVRSAGGGAALDEVMGHLTEPTPAAPAARIRPGA
jgi:hypothetical protein